MYLHRDIDNSVRKISIVSKYACLSNYTIFASDKKQTKEKHEKPF